MGKVLRYLIAAVIVALVVDAIDNVSHRAALALATIIILLVLFARPDLLRALGIEA